MSHFLLSQVGYLLYLEYFRFEDWIILISLWYLEDFCIFVPSSRDGHLDPNRVGNLLHSFVQGVGFAPFPTNLCSPRILIPMVRVLNLIWT